MRFIVNAALPVPVQLGWDPRSLNTPTLVAVVNPNYPSPELVKFLKVELVRHSPVPVPSDDALAELVTAAVGAADTQPMIPAPRQYARGQARRI